MPTAPSAAATPHDGALDLPVRVIVPHAGLDGFRFAMGSLRTAFPQASELAWRLFLRDTRSAHRQSLLGYLWIVLPPLVNTLVWVLLNKSEVVRIDSGAVPYPVFVLTGTVLWAAFNGAIMATLGVVGDARGMLAKVNFPHEALVYTAFLKSLIEAVIPALLLAPALWLYQVPLHGASLLFPVALLASLALGLALGLALVPIASLYSDVGRAVQLGLRFGFFVTPVIFPLPAAGLARSLMSLNPLTALIVSGRTWLAGAGETMPLAFVAIFSGSLALAAIGLLFFKVALPHLIERLST
jgi:lipopolysaccharide transport system permease protein